MTTSGSFRRSSERSLQGNSESADPWKRGRAWRSAGSSLLLFLVGACRAPGQGAPTPVAIDVDQHATAWAQQAIDAQARRLRDLSRLHVQGTLVLEWKDDLGEVHFEPQIDVMIWWRLPAETAVRGDKLNHFLFWLGTDASQWWLFTAESGDEHPSALRYGARGAGGAGGAGLDGLPGPESLMDLVGCMTLDARWSFVRDEASNAWIGTGPSGAGAGWCTTARWPDKFQWPDRVELRDAQGVTQFVSELPEEEYESVVVPGVSSASLPRFPHRILVSAVARGARLSINLDESDADLDLVPWENLFDFAGLREYLKPEQTLVDLPRPDAISPRP